MSQENKPREFSAQEFRDLIDSWKSFWMNQKQNSEEDYQNYFRRAFGIDANMAWDLAKRLEKHCLPYQEAQAKIAELENERLKQGLANICSQNDIEANVYMLGDKLKQSKAREQKLVEALEKIRESCEKDLVQQSRDIDDIIDKTLGELGLLEVKS